MEIKMFDRVYIKEDLPLTDKVYTVVAFIPDREGNKMVEIEDEDGFLAEDRYYPSQLFIIEE